jgi:hypothetical protein
VVESIVHHLGDDIVGQRSVHHHKSQRSTCSRETNSVLMYGKWPMYGTEEILLLSNSLHCA